MRNLTGKQKKLITKWFKKSGKKLPYETLADYSLYSVEDLTFEQWEELEEINDTEVLYQNVNSFIEELQERELMKTSWY